MLHGLQKINDITCKVTLIGDTPRGGTRWFANDAAASSTGPLRPSTLHYHPTLTMDINYNNFVNIMPVELGPDPPLTIAKTSPEGYAGYMRAVMSSEAFGLLYEYTSEDDPKEIEASAERYEHLWNYWHKRILEWRHATDSLPHCSPAYRPFIFVVEIDRSDRLQKEEDDDDSNSHLLSRNNLARRERAWLTHIDIYSRFESNDFLFFQVATDKERQHAWTRIAQQLFIQKRCAENASF